ANNTKRSNHQAANGKTRRSVGSADSTTATASACKSNRGIASSGRKSSVTPTSVRKIVDVKTTTSSSDQLGSWRRNKLAAHTTIVVATMTAIPPPCGVGSRCDDRAFGLANAYRASSGLRKNSRPKLIAAAATKDVRPSTPVKQPSPSD